MHSTVETSSVHKQELQQFHDDIILCCLLASDHIPKSRQSNQHGGIPGWNEFIRDYKDSAFFWHKLWKDNGSPNSGVLFDLRRTTRYKYHNALKIIKKHNDDIKAGNMARNMNSTGRNGFWTELKGSLGNSSSIPCTIDGMCRTLPICFVQNMTLSIILSHVRIV